MRTLARAESAVYVTDYRTVVRAKQLSKTMQDPYVTVAAACTHTPCLQLLAKPASRP